MFEVDVYCDVCVYQSNATRSSPNASALSMSHRSLGAPLIPSLPLTPPSGLPVYLAPFPWARLTRLHPAFSPFGLPVPLITSPHFDELRRPANLALQVTFYVIYPAAPA